MKTITICGSMQFFDQIKDLKIQLEDLGFNVLIPKEEGTDLDYSQLSEKEQKNLKHHFINDHIKKIKKSDGVLIANYTKNGIENYIGANTFLEMGFAYVLGKKIFLLNNIPDQSNKVEILGMKPIVLEGNFKKIM